MTVLVPAPRPAPPLTPGDRVARPRRYLMCAPTHFEVRYAINPWMDPTAAVDRGLALAQWEALRQTYLDLGHDVELIEPVPGLPDMVFAANGGLVVERPGARRPVHPPRAAGRGPGVPAVAGRRRACSEAVGAVHVNEGEGDFLAVGDVVLAGTGFRTDPASARRGAGAVRAARWSACDLVDPRFYHLDTALAVLDDETVAYYPGAFSEGSRAVLRRLFPDALLASAADAAVLGLNAVSDGRHVVLAAAAVELAQALRERGYVPVGGRPVRAAQGRRRRQVLHPGDPGMTTCVARARSSSSTARGAQLRTAAGRRRRRVRGLDHRRRRPPLPRLPRCVLGGELRARQPPGRSPPPTPSWTGSRWSAGPSTPTSSDRSAPSSRRSSASRWCCR